MTEKRFHYDWKTGRFKDTQSKSCATSNMRLLETQINNACFNYEKKIKKLEKENKELKNDEEQLSITFLGYKMKLRKVLRNHYLECQKWGDTHTQLIIKQIASDLELI